VNCAGGALACHWINLAAAALALSAMVFLTEAGRR
jgi:hypothetical protein